MDPSGSAKQERMGHEGARRFWVQTAVGASAHRGRRAPTSCPSQPDLGAGRPVPLIVIVTDALRWPQRFRCRPRDEETHMAEEQVFPSSPLQTAASAQRPEVLESFPPGNRSVIAGAALMGIAARVVRNYAMDPAASVSPGFRRAVQQPSNHGGSLSGSMTVGCILQPRLWCRPRTSSAFTAMRRGGAGNTLTPEKLTQPSQPLCPAPMGHDGVRPSNGGCCSWHRPGGDAGDLRATVEHGQGTDGRRLHAHPTMQTSMGGRCWSSGSYMEAATPGSSSTCNGLLHGPGRPRR